MLPILANYYVTYRCNAQCGFCDIWEKPSPNIHLADAERNLDDLRDLGVRIIDYTGGEPLLHPQIDRLLGAAKDRGFITTTTTNGLLYPKKAAALAGKIDLLHFSIDAADPERHDRSRGVRCFDKLMHSIEVALDIGERPDLLFTVTNDNLDELHRIYETISRPNKLILIINPLFEYEQLGEALRDDVMETVESFSHQPYTYLNPAFLSLRRSGGNNPDEPVCKAVTTSIVISPFNEIVLPCYHFALERIPIEGRLKQLWKSDRVAYHRALEGRHEVCRGCTVNCYFEPSFAVSPGHRYFWQSVPSKLKYVYTKFLLQRLDARLHPSKPALLPDFERRNVDLEAERAQRPIEKEEVLVPLPVL